MVHTLGNLTLVNRRLNPSLSNGSWQAKREGLRQHSVLQLNRGLLEQWGKSWDEETILERSERLFELIRNEWPSASASGAVLHQAA